MSIQGSPGLAIPKHPSPTTSSQVSPPSTALSPSPKNPTQSQPPPLSPSRSRDPPHFLLHQPPPSPPPSSSSSESATRTQHMSPSSKPPSYSFNVLRADPVTSSLEHVASSTTLRPRASSATTPSHPGMHGSAPVFRVAMAPADSRARHRPHRSVREILPDTRERHHSREGLTPSISREADLAHLRSPSSAILSFPVSDHPVSTTSALITTDGRRVHLRSEIPGAALQGEGRGKKHQCPHCGKRFNRPSSMKIHVNTHTGAKPYRCPFPGCGREFNVNSNMRRHWRNHSRSAPVRLPDPDAGRTGAYHPHPHHHPHHHARMDGLPHHALMSPPATNSSVSEGNSDEEGYSDEEPEGYAMDVDLDDCDIGTRGEAESDEGMRGVVRDAPDGPHPHPPPPPPLPTTSHSMSIKGSAGSSSSSDDSVWSRSVSPVRGPASSSGYGYGHGPQLHRHAHANSNAQPSQDQQGRHPLQSQSQSYSHGHGHGQTSDYIYRPSIAAYAISCTDSRVSTALRPAFTSSSSCTARDRDRERDRYHARATTGGGREREKRHGQGYPSRG
ncbi:hypothetical protein J3R83DRAFT_70 [Lanmaoa asiatica]|nr:hypothetical protein J3R83DRAFT_70 [Lanmaoa asiatica]